LLPERFTPPDLSSIHKRLRAWHEAHAGTDPRLACLAALSALSLAGDYLADFGQLLLASEAGRDRRIQHIAAGLRDNAHRPFDIETCIAGTSLGRSQADRLFRSAFGLSPKAYWTRHRLGLAQAMLTGTNLGIQAIADRLGFSDIYYFSRWFRQHAGVTATSFRRLGRAF
jgi:AraC-like DNA-binding protein